MRQRQLKAGLSALLLLSIPGLASAYVGPGAGLSAIGTVIALIGAVLLGIVGFIWYPVKRLLRKRKPGADAEDAGPAARAAVDEGKDVPAPAQAEPEPRTEH